MIVELGVRMQGVISARAFPVPPELGEEHEFTLRGREEEGLWSLALRDARPLSSWEEMEVETLVRARVVRAVPGGLELRAGRLHGFMPRSETGLDRGTRVEVLVGKNLNCEVIEVEPERQRVLLSRKRVLQKERREPAARRVGSLEPGEVVEGRVTRIEPYGVFLRFGAGLVGMIHVSDLSYERVEHPGELLKKGDRVRAKILHLRRGGKRIALGLKQMRSDPWEDYAREHAPGEIVPCVVARLVSYGAFVDVTPGVRGLVHRSEMDAGVGPDPRAALRIGAALSVRILRIDARLARLSLSLCHPDGAPIDRDEAEAAAAYEKQRDAMANEPFGAPLGPRISGALARDPSLGGTPRRAGQETCTRRARPFGSETEPPVR